MIEVMLDNNAFMPERAHKEDAGWDIRTPKPVHILPGDNITVDTGVHIAIPYGYVGMLKSKSGLNVKNDLTGEGVIDCGYTGSIVVKLYNHGKEPHMFYEGDKLIQLVIIPICMDELVQVEELSTVDTERGDNGFGSTGK